MALSRQLSAIKSVFGFDDSSVEKEEKAVAGVKREPIAAEQFLQKLKQKKSDKQLNIEVRVRSFPFDILNRYEIRIQENNLNIILVTGSS